jgi:hypothetical protein
MEEDERYDDISLEDLAEGRVVKCVTPSDLI